MPYLLLAVAALVMLFGVAKVSRTPKPLRGMPWGQLLVWAILFCGGLSIWIMSARIS